MLMPSEPHYNALVATPAGALPAVGLAREEFVAALRPVYMCVREHWSFHPCPLRRRTAPTAYIRRGQLGLGGDPPHERGDLRRTPRAASPEADLQFRSWWEEWVSLQLEVLALHSASTHPQDRWIFERHVRPPSFRRPPCAPAPGSNARYLVICVSSRCLWRCRAE
ncbi:hypothetical protein C8J57DRAFT_115186 [Mycena rebaudengoi]|nr:hypothetical protein C8J57DRAFT_115186 [Mycena rebaudengoi]